jgi:hypothetical protein
MTVNGGTKSEIAYLIRQMLSQISEEEQDAVYEKIGRLSPDPDWSIYIFHSPEFYDEAETLDIEGVVEKMAVYKPIII